MNLFYYLMSSISGLPSWTRWIFVALTAAAMLGISVAVSPTVAFIVLGGLVVVALLVGGFLLLVRRARQKKAAAFGGDLHGQAGVTPGQIVDPARRARLDELRLSFERGVEKFRAAGKNLYEVPWYVIVGEPGAGKTEAIRHSNVGFPPGMQDEFQGVGGTINMNWWFTNHAVILDTAGRLLFEEVEPGTTGEWRVFLEMLKKHRSNCPINGLFLAIPAESLIKDTAEEIQRKAGKIAQQLEQIQRQLDVRFPAYVVITKCDLLNGFREFFDDLTDPQAQHQMTGWSNPDPLDAPFRPELVDEHIHSVVERLRRRRQGLLLDPAPRSFERRADEVDRLYALPHSITLIARNLRQYLETIFIAGTWSERPLFLRGIYFTSSLREGSSLDQELAQALSLPVEALPEGRAWERERSYFLRDVFVDKAFVERGLVTRATNTKQLVRRRRLTLSAFAIAGLVTLLTLSWFGFNALQTSIGTQGGYWARASDGWTGDTWNPVVEQDIGTRYKYRGDQPVGQGDSSRSRLLFHEPETPVSVFHAKLHELSNRPLAVSWIFRPLMKFGVAVDRDRKTAQRIVYDASAIKPAVDASRQKMAQPVPELSGGVADVRREGEALLSLVRLEAAILKRREKVAGVFNGEKFLPPLLRYVAEAKHDPGLVTSLDSSYASGAAWPPDWLSGGFTLAENTAVNQGLNRFVAEAHKVARSRKEVFPILLTLMDAVRQFARAENDLYDSTRRQGAIEEIDKRVFDDFGALQTKKQALDLALAQAKKAGLFEGSLISLGAAYERIFGELRARYEIARPMLAETEELLQANPGGVKKAIEAVAGSRKEHVLFREIREKLRGVVAELEEKFEPTLSESDLAELKMLDELYLTDLQTGAIQYEVRWSLYDTSVNKASPAPTYAQSLDLIGADWKPLTELLARVDTIRTQVLAYKGLLSEKALTICKYCFARAEQVHRDEFCKAYLAQATKRVGAALRFPLVWTPINERDALKPDELVQAGNLLDRIKHDLQSPTFATVKSSHRQPLVDFQKKLLPLEPIRNALLTPEKHLRLCSVILLGRATQFRLSGQQIGMDTFKAIELRVGTVDHATPIKQGVIGQTLSDSASDVEIGKFTLHEPFHFHFFNNMGEARVTVDMPAPTAWTALQFLFERSARRVDDGRRWQLVLAPAKNKLIWFEFRFEAPLPEFDDWPTPQSLGLTAAPRGQ